MLHYNITVKGKVQGVFFRASAKQMADLLGIKGTVKNETNGDVYIEAEGDEDMLVKFIQWCHHGPAKAGVEHVSVRLGVFLGFKSFEIVRGEL
ncbi:MAG: acylphosphatase [Bacteroidota bacterium]